MLPHLSDFFVGKQRRVCNVARSSSTSPSFLLPQKSEPKVLAIWTQAVHMRSRGFGEDRGAHAVLPNAVKSFWAAERKASILWFKHLLVESTRSDWTRMEHRHARRLEGHEGLHWIENLELYEATCMVRVSPSPTCFPPTSLHLNTRNYMSSWKVVINPSLQGQN